MIRKFAFAATAALIAAAALSPTAALAGGGGGKHKFFKHNFHNRHFVHAPIVVHDPCYVTKWFKTPFGFQKKVIFVCY